MTQENLSADVVIVGGGPAGSAAAIELCRSGRSVVIIDKAVFPRDKCCGDGLTTLALRELEQLGLDPGRVDNWFDVNGAVLRSPSGRQVTVPLPTDGRYAAVAPRLELDSALLDLARDAGADVRDGHGFRALDTSRSESDDVVTVEADDLTIDTRYVIAADGMWSPVRKATGSNDPGYLGEWHGFRQYASDVTGTAAHELHVWFDPDLLPGYAWSFPLPGNRANIGFGVLRDGSRTGKEIKAIWPDLLARPHIVEALGDGFTMEDRHTAWPIPARIDSLPLTSGRVLFVGDAAAATDVMTGEGIGQALLTGRIAAEALVAAGASRPDDATRIYTREVQHHLVADHRMSLALGSVLAKPWGARGAIRVIEASGSWGRRNFARWMFEDEPRAVALTPSRWHRRLLTRPGAYRS
ncbi:NAD(P)/FAD-dependent oxidoreductase [Ilumatobacter nonamiensis]|uniref:NAD(P)/FAD-dependent oxidoreductase n=1 Tax=Ilumatobacter nonamiensis TaxID=467093 RepID=UPI00034A9EE5|nr:NAD(P)/FAD-dependent oxidoreductase [Ilumatobacter nonamiensis]